MVACLGFVSILAFATILASAGQIFNIIVDDVATRFRLPCVSRPWIAVPLWGLLWFAWMAIIATDASKWWQTRLGIHVTMGEAFWFAFLSTTTVGLGDYYFQPEAIFGKDLLSMSLEFLTAFVFISTFLGKLSELLSEYVPNPGQKLGERLKTANLFSINGNEEGSNKAKRDARVDLIAVLEIFVAENRRTDGKHERLVLKQAELLQHLLKKIEENETGFGPQKMQVSCILDFDVLLLRRILQFLSPEDLIPLKSCCRKLCELSMECRKDKCL